MSSVSKRTLNWIKELLPETEEERIKKAVSLIWNAGYKAGLRARPCVKTNARLPEDLELK